MRVLELYTHEGCLTRVSALEMLRKILASYHEISFTIIDVLKFPDKAKALGIKMSPTLVMDGKVISVGLLDENELRAILQTEQTIKAG